MRITLTIDTDNSAFEADPFMEVARILKDASRKVGVWDIPSWRNPIPLYDINGNQVGQIRGSRT